MKRMTFKVASDSQSIDEKVVAVGLTGLLSCRLKLAPGDVHLWHAMLDDRLAYDLKYLLSNDEKSRAESFHFEDDRNDFIAGRVLLRTLLAVYAGIDSDKVRFGYAEKGKPYLDETHASGIKFNLAHAHGRALFAFSCGREVGVDLEFMRDDLADEKVAERFFSPSEIDSLKAVDPELRKEAFFNCWTRKEAYIKARGEGLSMALDEFDVSLAPGEPAVLIRNHKEPTESERWSMRSIPMLAGYVAALVVEGHDWKLRTFALE
jgi:4'-phosphopantetheinyl transferase